MTHPARKLFNKIRPKPISARAWAARKPSYVSATDRMYVLQLRPEPSQGPRNKGTGAQA